MNRKTFTIPLGSDISGVAKVKYKVVLEDYLSEFRSFDSHVKQQQFLTLILNNPNLLQCGDQPFERLTMYHNGERWIVEAHAESIHEQPKKSST